MTDVAGISLLILALASAGIAIAVVAAASGRGFIWLFEGGIELWRRHDERPRR